MRLKKLKLAGFKSFVEPTQVLFPSPLVAVVGPNGCGKSNIIDAVRWVMGESSAKYLRGESMSDVIFNGSTQRKPLGQASVELVFDNSDKSVGGEYAHYNEIAIKRLVTREGQSNYFLNNTRCRRKDITDIFLGTGLGPRSYSIIQQGTISRIIEAKPEELRVYLEEAAGISKYKERRRETENRIRHTRENLERVADIREELAKQLERLQRQAKAAEKFKELKAQERRYKAELLALKWDAINQERMQQQEKIDAHKIQLEAMLAKQREIEFSIEQYRLENTEKTESFNTIQAHYYELGAQIARLEETIGHQQQRRTQLEQDLSQAKSDIASAIEHQEHDQMQLEDILAEIEQLEPRLCEFKSEYEESQQKLLQKEAQRTQWQSQWDEFNQMAAESSKVAHVEQTRIAHLEQQIQKHLVKLEKLEDEQQQQSEDPIALEIERFDSQKNDLTARAQDIRVSLEQSTQNISNYKAKNHDCSDELNRVRGELQCHEAKVASLEALQKAALGKENESLNQWLSAHELNQAKRLAQTLSVEAGWETAVETILGDALQAICVDNLQPLCDLVDELSEGNVQFVAIKDAPPALLTQDLPPLYKKIKCEYSSLESLFTGIYAADSLSQAMTWLASIGPHESIVTPQGFWLSHNWLRVLRSRDEKSGVLQRQEDLKQTSLAIQQSKKTLAGLEERLQEGQEKLSGEESLSLALQRQANDLNHQLADCQAKLRVNQGKLDAIRQRQLQIEHDKQEVNDALQEYQQDLMQARHAWQEAMQSMEMDAQRRDTLTEQRNSITQDLEALRSGSRRSRDEVHQLEIRIQSNQSQQHALKANITRAEEQLAALRERCETLAEALQSVLEPAEDYSGQLQDKLFAHSEKEQQLSQAKRTLEDTQAQLAGLEKQRFQVDEQGRKIQAVLEQLKMDGQALEVRCQTFIEMLQETDFELKPLLENMPEHANTKEWEEALSQLATRISRLGAINLAAIDEYQVESERKQYLDSQYEDLVKALETLENAISKIDKETRQRFKETYERVNDSFKSLFPRLFGGGRAYLELTSEDWLESGVTVMAQPPGKRNSSIHLLSGGEKAMTAVGLVFAIFQLNPSPFCMLDEVDAPLDDANVGRFCAMVKEMSDKVQFIFITHNKVTMELADQLSGVTMHEPGVSRLVSVDVDEAVSLAQA